MKNLFIGLNITPDDEVQFRVQQRLNDMEQAYLDNEVQEALRNGDIHYDGECIELMGHTHWFFWNVTPHELLEDFETEYEDMSFNSIEGYSSKTITTKASDMDAEILRQYIVNQDLIEYCETHQYNEKQTI